MRSSVISLDTAVEMGSGISLVTKPLLLI